MPMRERLRRLNLEYFKAYTGIILGALLLFLASPPYDQFLLAYPAIFIALLSCKKGEEAFKKGFFFGSLYYIFTMYWISYVLKLYGNIPLFIAIVLMILLCMYLALYYGLFFKIFCLLRDKISPLLYPLLMSVIFILLEYGRAKIMTGFPWMLLGYTQHKFTSLIQISHFFSVYGVSFVVIFFNLALYEIALKRNTKSFINIMTALVIILVSCLYGKERIKGINKNLETKKSITLSVIQGNIDQSQKWEKSLQRSIINKYIALTEKEMTKKPAIVIWPETALPFIYGNDIELTEYLRSFLINKDFYLLTGFPHYDFGEDGKTYYTNSAGIFFKGELLGKYTKTHLVPFGEYVPLKKILFFVEKLVVAAGDFLSGTELKVLETDGIKIGVLICYESIFPEISRDYKSKGVNILVNLTNDAWFGKTAAPYQHFAMSKFRAIENEVFLVRAANTGISGIIKPTGEVIISTPIFSDESFTESIKY